MCLVCRDLRGISSAGRAPALHAGGQRFDPAILHHFICSLKLVMLKFNVRVYLDSKVFMAFIESRFSLFF